MRVRLNTEFRDGRRGDIRDWPEEQCLRLIEAGIVTEYDQMSAEMDAYFALVDSGVDSDTAAAAVWAPEEPVPDSPPDVL